MNKILKIGRNILAMFALNLIWIICILLLFKGLLGYELNEIFKYFQGLLFPSDGGLYLSDNVYNTRKIFFAIIFAPLWEELLFRFFPLEIYKHIGEKKLLLPIVCTSSIIFGWLHGSVVNILIQGVSGTTMSFVYLYNNGGYWGSVISHALWNTMILFGLPYISNMILL